jgi:hypothetical protein
MQASCTSSAVFGAPTVAAVLPHADHEKRGCVRDDQELVPELEPEQRRVSARVHRPETRSFSTRRAAEPYPAPTGLQKISSSLEVWSVSLSQMVGMKSGSAGRAVWQMYVSPAPRVPRLSEGSRGARCTDSPPPL